MWQTLKTPYLSIALVLKNWTNSGIYWKFFPVMASGCYIEILIFPTTWSWSGQILCKEKKQSVKGRMTWFVKSSERVKMRTREIQIQIPSSKGSHRNLVVAGLKGRALCMRTQGKKHRNICVYMYTSTYIVLISQCQEATSRSVLFHTHLSDLEKDDRFLVASNYSEQQKSTVIAKSCFRDWVISNNLACGITWWEGNTMGETKIWAVHGEFWALGALIHKRNAGITLTGSLKTSSHFPAEERKQINHVELLRKKINQARGCWCKNPYLWSHLHYWGQLWSCHHKNL